MTRDDPELGLVRRCSACAEEWPFDAEFWHILEGKLDKRWPARCIACCLDYFAQRRRLRMELSRMSRPVDDLAPPVEGNCNAILRHGRCGRRLGHRLACRSVEAMAHDAARKRAA
jgi:hypothetical protein